MPRGHRFWPHRQVFGEEIRNAIREAIFLEAESGDRIIEPYWAKELGVSQGPARRPSGSGGHGAGGDGALQGIPDPDADGEGCPGQLQRADLLLESKSIRDAIIQLDDQRMAEWWGICAPSCWRWMTAPTRGDLRQFTDCDTLFHRAIIDATGNQVLLKLWEQCNMRNWFRFSAPDGRDQSAAAPVRPPADFGGHLRPGCQDGHLHAGGPSDRPDGRLHPGASRLRNQLVNAQIFQNFLPALTFHFSVLSSCAILIWRFKVTTE